MQTLFSLSPSTWHCETYRLENIGGLESALTDDIKIVYGEQERHTTHLNVINRSDLC